MNTEQHIVQFNAETRELIVDAIESYIRILHKNLAAYIIDDCDRNDGKNVSSIRPELVAKIERCEKIHGQLQNLSTAENGTAQSERTVSTDGFPI